MLLVSKLKQNPFGGKKSEIGQNKRFRHTTIGKAALSLVESALWAQESCF